MKSKKLSLILVLGAVLVIGWFVSVRSVTGSEVMKEQKKLVEEADALLDRKLYVRAIALYEEALSQDSPMTGAVQEKLLEAYEAYGDYEAYLALVNKRIAAKAAGETEYLTTAQYYVQRRDLESAIGILKKGMEQLDSQALNAFYEEHRYACRIQTTGYMDILPTATSQLMPAYNGEKWGYINADGREVLPFVYDAAVPFNDQGYGVVLLNQTYYTILQGGDWYGADDGSSYDKMTDVLMVSGSRILGQRNGSYSYFNYDFEPIAATHQYSEMTGNACGVAAVQKDGKWGIISNTGDVVVDFTLEDVAVNSLGCAFAGDRAMVKENGKWRLMDTEGNRIGNGNYENAKAPESGGYIAVADATGKWGFIDRMGVQVIDCQYSDAHSFSQHLAAVQLVNDWGYISESNKMVIAGPFQSALPFHNGIAQTALTDGTALVVLEYFEE